MKNLLIRTGYRVDRGSAKERIPPPAPRIFWERAFWLLTYVLIL